MSTATQLIVGAVFLIAGTINVVRRDAARLRAWPGSRTVYTVSFAVMALAGLSMILEVAL